MSTSLPPLPEEIGDSPSAKPQGDPDTPTGSAFSGGLPTLMQAVQQIEAGLKTLAVSAPSLTPMAAQMISMLRTAVPSAMGAGAGASPSGGPTGPAMTGMGQNPTALPAPPQPPPGAPQ